MNQSNRALLAFAAGLALTVSVGCSSNNTALVGRETLPARAGPVSQSEIVGTVVRDRYGIQRDSSSTESRSSRNSYLQCGDPGDASQSRLLC